MADAGARTRPEIKMDRRKEQQQKSDKLQVTDWPRARQLIPPNLTNPTQSSPAQPSPVQAIHLAQGPPEARAESACERRGYDLGHVRYQALAADHLSPTFATYLTGFDLD